MIEPSFTNKTRSIETWKRFRHGTQFLFAVVRIRKVREPRQSWANM